MNNVVYFVVGVVSLVVILVVAGFLLATMNYLIYNPMILVWIGGAVIAVGLVWLLGRAVFNLAQDFFPIGN